MSPGLRNHTDSDIADLLWTMFYTRMKKTSATYIYVSLNNKYQIFNFIEIDVINSYRNLTLTSESLEVHFATEDN